LLEWTVLAGETEVLGENLPDASLSTTNPTWPDPGRRCGKPATHRLSYDAATALQLSLLLISAVDEEQLFK
jgi:hypothetical protein